MTILVRSMPRKNDRFFFNAPLLLALPRVDLQQGPDSLANAAPSLGSDGTARAVRQEVLRRRGATQKKRRREKQSEEHRKRRRKKN